MRQIIHAVFIVFLFTVLPALGAAEYAAPPISKLQIMDPGDELIQVFPNPTTSHIELSKSDGVAQIIVYNLVGKKMKTFVNVADGQKYYVGDLPNGMYLVQLLSASNDIITTRRVSKR